MVGEPGVEGFTGSSGSPGFTGFQGLSWFVAFVLCGVLCMVWTDGSEECRCERDTQTICSIAQHFYLQHSGVEKNNGFLN